MFRDKKIYLTYVITAINVSICILMFLIDKSLDFSVSTLIDFGAKYNPLIADGQYYRLITPMFLHSDLTHLLFNMYALNIFGRNIELIYGKSKFIVIYLIAGIFGTLGSFIFSSSVAVGASGAIFGLLGSYFYLYVSKPKAFNRSFLKNLLAILGINLVFGIVVPNIDNWAHVSGLVGGFIISWAVGIKGEKVLTPKRVLVQVLVVVIIFTSLFTGIKLTQNSAVFYIHKGEAYLQENDIDAAEIQFKNGLSTNEHTEIFHYYLGHISLAKGDNENAKYHFQKAVEIDPRLTEAREVLDELTKQ